MSEYSINPVTSVAPPRVTVVGVALGKTGVEARGQDAAGQVPLTGQHRPGQFKARLAPLPGCLVGLAPYGRAHHWARV